MNSAWCSQTAAARQPSASTRRPGNYPEPVPGRRDPGTLESEVLGRLSSANAPMSPTDLRTALGGDLSYSTITTVLSRLQSKGFVKRARSGRGFVYTLCVDEAAVVAMRMRADLRRSGNRVSVLSRFVSTLDDDEAASLRQVLADLQSQQ